MRDAYYISSKTEYMEAISKLLYLYLGRKKEAIRNLETHKRLYGCNKYLCIYLINFYGDMDNIPMVIQTYQELYKSSREERFALQLINIYKQQGDYGGLIGFLKSSGFDNSMLLKIYMSQKLFSEGLKLSQKLYRKEGKPEHLAQSAIFEYEANRIDISRNTLLSIVVKLETAVKELEDPLYLNFLGYLMIDNSIRVADGVEYVKRALKKEPESIFFLDSLAWGYYKLGRCKDAEREIRKLIDSGIRDKEILSHWETIKGCIK
jgi:tetratricopeptide (TPR) repeat protein